MSSGVIGPASGAPQVVMSEESGGTVLAGSGAGAALIEAPGNAAQALTSEHREPRLLVRGQALPTLLAAGQRGPRGPGEASLTNLTLTADTGPVAEGDSLVVAINRLQSQITALTATVAALQNGGGGGGETLTESLHDMLVGVYDTGEAQIPVGWFGPAGWGGFTPALTVIECYAVIVNLGEPGKIRMLCNGDATGKIAYLRVVGGPRYNLADENTDGGATEINLAPASGAPGFDEYLADKAGQTISIAFGLKP